MKTVAMTVAVLALGLSACAKNDQTNTDMTDNDMYTENAAATDMNMSMNDEAAASDALENASNAIENADEAVSNATDAVEDTTTNQ